MAPSLLSACSVFALVLLVLFVCAASTSVAPGTQLFSFNNHALAAGGLTVDGNGTMWVTNPLDGSVYVLAPLTSASPGQLLAVYRDPTLFLCYPTNLALDSVGNMYVSDTCYGTRIAVLASASSPTPAAELYSFTANSSLNSPNGVALDSAGNLYVADSGNNRVVVLASITSTQHQPGDVLFVFNNSASPFDYPGDVAIDAAGRIHVSDCGNGRVVVLAGIQSISPPPGTALLSIYDTGSTELSYGDYELALDAANNVYIPDTYNNRLVVLSGYGSAAPGTELFAFTAGGLINQPDGVALDAAGNIYVGNPGDHSVIVLSGIHSAVPGTQLGHFVPSGTALPFSFPQGIQLDTSGNIYVQDNGNQRVAVLAPLSSVSPPPGTLLHSYTDSSQALARGRNLALDAAGNMYVICVPRLVVLAAISSTSPPAGSQLASFNSTVFPLSFPTGVAVDAAGNMYVADGQLGRLTVLAALASTLVRPGTILLTINVSAGCVALDSKGNIYAGVTDSNGGRVLVYAALMSTAHKPGSLLYTFADNATAAQALTSPYGLAFDALDQLYITDANTYRVVVLASITSAHPGSELYTLYDQQQGFNQIVGITVDSSNRVYVVDGGNNGVRVLAGIPVAAAASGDPQFRGFRGQSYQVHGLDQGVYSIISSPTLQMNALFTFLDAGACPAYPSSMSTPPSHCWSHPGSYFGSLGLRTSGGDRLRIDAGDGRTGFAQLNLNNRSLLHHQQGT